MLKKTLIIEWCTRFNGLTVSLANESLLTPQYEELLEKVNEDPEGLPSLTYEIIGEELMTSVCEGDEDGDGADPEDIEEALSPADYERIYQHTASLFKKHTDELFDFEIEFNHIDS